MTRIKLGWRLAKDSWAVLQKDRSLAVFPVLAFASATVAFLLLIAPGVVGAAIAQQEWIVAPFALAAAYAATFLTIYFNVALAGAASLSLDGRDTTLADGLAVAKQRRGQIARWAVIQVLVGMLIEAIESLLGNSVAGRTVSAIVSTILSAAWSVATFFVIPVLAFEGTSPGDAFKRSVALIRERWGEGFVGSASIGLAVFLVMVLPVGALVGLAVLGFGASPALGIVPAVLALLLFLGAAIVGSALNVIFRVALYRYATAGQPAPGFAEADLAGAFHS